ncbi:hypothetical protein [Paracoccus rhizosphaerae]|uniref:Uncharacterized protein n=1 Tax=Paracoccus rhizosphaerae TaxID=1133347 RepID=A0ABV6CQX1_9RHOB|nr:hypothetical protein [Paracoccus rhizosphaerae]
MLGCDLVRAQAGVTNRDPGSPAASIKFWAIATEHREAEGLEGRRPEFDDPQREEHAALAGMDEEPLCSP